MSGVARLLQEYGCEVSGSDAHESAVTEQLQAMGIAVLPGHDAAYGADADVVLWSPAVRLDHVELESARRRGALLVTRADLFAELATMARVLGVTGTHGKTTATSMLAHVLHAEGRDDGRLLGAEVRGLGANGHWGRDDLVVEVDESYGTFVRLAPFALGLLNVEPDHLDHYGSVERLEDAFAALVTRTTGPVVVWMDDPGAARVAGLAGRRVTSVGTQGDHEWCVRDVTLGRRGSTFTLAGPDRHLDVALNVPGAHNVANAAVVATLALSLGVSPRAVHLGLAAFGGAPRRFEFRGVWCGIDVIEDYAHLPGEIAATLAAARAAGYERVAVVFQPHRVTRTLAVGPAFAPAFDDAALICVTDIYTSGEANPQGVTSELVLDPLRERRGAAHVRDTPHFDDARRALEEAVTSTPFDALFILGAGDIGDLAGQLVHEAS
jgi:UDP-N-acetylmuramate--alanine ligase